MIPVAKPLIEKNEIDSVIECLKLGWISSAGAQVKLFEQRWSDYCDMKFGIAVSSGTSALQISARLLNLEPGDEVIMPTFTIISCALAIIGANGRPILVDSDSKTWQMDVSQIEAKITNHTKAIMIVHTYGHPVEIEPIFNIARKHNLMIIEDAAEAHGAKYKNKTCGSFGDISIFSFYANKIITTGEGGMILTNNAEFADRARSLRNICFQDENRFVHNDIGYSSRMSNIQAALGAEQATRIESIVQQKREIAKKYTERLESLHTLILPYEANWARNVYWVYGILLSNALQCDASEFRMFLNSRGIETRPFFLGMHEQPIFQKMRLFEHEKYPVAENMSRRGFYIPSGLDITDGEIDQVCSAIQDGVSLFS